LKKPAERNSFANSQIKVLILCQDARTCYQLNQYLTQGAEKYLFYTAMRNDIKVTKLSEKYKTLNSNDGVDPTAYKIKSVDTYFKPAQPSQPVQQEVKEPKPSASKKARKKDEEDEDFLKSEDGTDEMENPLDMAAELFSADKDDESFMFRDSYILTMSQRQIDPNKSINTMDEADDSLANSSLLENFEFDTFTGLENFDLTAAINQSNKPVVYIQTFKSEMNGFVNLDRTLEELQPRYVVMYHCNVTAIRQIEVYEARRERDPIHRTQVYAVIHSKTVEEQSYLTGLRREKQAFEMLIETKRTMVVPEYQDGKSDDAITTQRKQDLSTRKAGGQEDAEIVMPKVIVDMREFRSDLPCLIHKRGIEVVPLTITVSRNK
jgi:DNA excision repair protein ERCC-4